MNMKTFFSPENQNLVGFTHEKNIPPPKKLFRNVFFSSEKMCCLSNVKKKLLHLKKKKIKKKNISLNFTDENVISWGKNHMEPPHACCLLANVSWRLVYTKVICMLGSDKHCLSNVSNGVITVPPIKLALWWTQSQKFNTALMWLRL